MDPKNKWLTKYGSQWVENKPISDQFKTHMSKHKMAFDKIAVTFSIQPWFNCTISFIQLTPPKKKTSPVSASNYIWFQCEDCIQIKLRKKILFNFYNSKLKNSCFPNYKSVNKTETVIRSLSISKKYYNQNHNYKMFLFSQIKYVFKHPKTKTK